MNTVDKIYELISKDNTINTFNNNLELFQEFYYHNMMIRYNGAKVIEIYKYLLSLNISEYHETMPYINSKIFEDFNNYELFVTQSVYSNHTSIDDDYVDLLYNLINEYNQFKLYENQGLLTKLLSENRFIRDYTGSMMIILNSSFFKLSNENIEKMMDSIKNNSYLQNIIEEGKMGKQLLDVDYIFQYTSRFLFNAQFINEENIDNDLLLNSIKDSKIRDLKTLKKIFKDIDIYMLFSFFDNNITQFVDMLGQSFKDDFDKIEVFKILYNKLIEANDFRTIMNFIMNDDRNNMYITDDEKKFVLNEFCCHYSKNITDEEINYVLNQEYNQLFLINLKEDFKKNNWSLETQNKVQELTKNIIEYDYDFNDSLENLGLLFRKIKPIDMAMLISSLKRLIKDYLHNDDIKIYIIKDDSINGCANQSQNCIKLNYNSIKKLLDTSNYEETPESIHILETIFHEARHIQQFTYMQEENMSDDIYTHYKEDIISNINLQYYDKNYFGISFEKDARITGSKMVVSLLKNYFPYMKECINYYEKKVIKELKEEVSDKYIFELSEKITVDEAIEKLLTINPDIIKQFPCLIREYNLDGSRKDNEQIERKNI